METSVFEFTKITPGDVVGLLEELQAMLDICGEERPELEFILDSIGGRLDDHILRADAVNERRWLEEALDLADGATAAIDHLLATEGTSWEEVWDEYERQFLATVAY